MILQSLDGVMTKDKIKCCCDMCGDVFERRYNSVKVSRKRWGIDEDYCKSCSCKLSPKPQNKKEFWTEDKKHSHGESIKHSETYKIGIDNRVSFKGENNPMWGKSHTIETKTKMSKSRIGKIGENSTAWKGGKTSLNRRVKGIIHTRYNWYKRVYVRDGFKCVKCGCNDKLDAHHVKPISIIIKQLLEHMSFDNDNDALEWIILQPEIIDCKLNNGVTLCRDCHKEIHYKWGTHESKVQE